MATINETRRLRLQLWIDEHGGNQAALARTINKSTVQLNQWLGTGKQGNRNISTTSARRIEKIGGKPHGWLDQPVITDDQADAHHRAGADSEHTDILAFSAAVGLSDGEEADEYAETHSLKFRRESLRRKHLLGKPLSVLYGRGDSMEPVIGAGDAVLFDQGDTRPQHGELYVVQLPGVGVHDAISVKQCEVIGYGDSAIVTFRALNPHGDHHWRCPRRMDDPRSPISVVGRVRWLGKWV